MHFNLSKPKSFIPDKRVPGQQLDNQQHDLLTTIRRGNGGGGGIQVVRR